MERVFAGASRTELPDNARALDLLPACRYNDRASRLFRYLASPMRPSGQPVHINDDTIQRALTQLRGLVKSRGLKSSKVRESIAQAALRYHGHFSVEDLLRTLQDGGVHDAHLATIYRAMPLLVDAGLIAQTLVAKAEGQLYEAHFEREHHDHLVCRNCGKVIEYHSEALEALQREIAERFDFEIADHVHVLEGRCGDCRSKPIVAKSPQAGG